MNLPNEADFFGWVLYLLDKYGMIFLRGAGVTLMLALVGTLIGCLIGLLVGVLRTLPYNKKANPIIKILYKVLQFILAVYIEVFRGTPMIVQAMVLYYGSKQMFGVDMSAMFAGFFIVSINTGAYMAETVRGGIDSIDVGQTEAAKAIGMTHWQTMVSVIMPQTLRNILPQIGNNLIINIKDTSVLNIISVTELFFSGNSAAGAYFRYFEVFFIICVIYFIMTFTCSRLLRWIERKIDGSGYYSLVEIDMMADPCGHNPVKKHGGNQTWKK
ncbi:amino acid ABC transporter permease [Caproiciproducens sp. R1]|uniref:amino acid ABC transporter permease n=1 Tax=Caproiciproducens sp. R1 TaxID=3435000 RepID=UPI0040347783